MKISTKRFLMFALVGAGLFAMFYAYRSDSSKVTNAFEADFNSYDNSTAVFDNIAIENGVDQNAIKNGVDQSAFDIVALPTIAPVSEPSNQPLVIATATPDGDTLSLPDDAFQLDSIEPETVDAEKPVTKSMVDKTEWTTNPFAKAGNLRRSYPVAKMPERAPESVDSAIGTEVNESTLATPAEFVRPAPQAANFGLSEIAAQKAVHHIEYGKSLARRNATEAARQEFLSALRILAESLDANSGGNAHAASLRNGLLAMKEAGDFVVDDPQGQIILKVGYIIESHETQAISKEEAATMTASDATRRYLEFAGHELGSCGGQNVVAAEALFCLGKMQSISAQNDPDPESMELTQAIIFHHASLTANPGNFRSANELGVLLARNGQLGRAEVFLKESLKINPVPQSWANLAKVHQRKGTQEDALLANLAINEYQMAVHREPVASVPAAINWVEPGEFVARSPLESPDAVMAAQARQGLVVPAANVETEDKPSFVDRIGSILVPKSVRR